MAKESRAIEAQKVAPQNRLIVKTSALSAIPIWWGFIVLCLLPLVAGVLMISGMLDIAGLLAGMEAIPADIQEILATAFPFVFIGLGVLIFILLVRKGYKASRVKYIIRDCMLLQRNKNKDVCRLIFKPGMSVSIPKRTFKEKFFGYADVVISFGPGEGGEVTLHKIKKPKQVKEELDRIIGDNCMSFARTMVFNV